MLVVNVGLVLLVGWTLALIAVRAFYTPLPKPTSMITWGYRIARGIVWGYFLGSAVVGTGSVIYLAWSNGEGSSLGSLLRAFLIGAAIWPFLVLYAVACTLFRTCFG